MRLDLVGDKGIAVIGARLEAAELVLRIVDEHRKEQLALVGDEQRPVVGDELRAQRGGEEDEENDERPRPAPVAAEIVEPPAVHRRELEPGAPRGLDAALALQAPRTVPAIHAAPTATPSFVKVGLDGRLVTKGVERRRTPTDSLGVTGIVVHPHTSRVSKSMRGSIQV